MERQDILHVMMAATVSIHRKCPFCGTQNIVDVKPRDYADWQSGTLIQNAFPYLSKDEREILQTGICNTCFPTCDYDETDAEIDEYRRHGYDL